VKDAAFEYEARAFGLLHDAGPGGLSLNAQIHPFHRSLHFSVEHDSFVPVWAHAFGLDAPRRLDCAGTLSFLVASGERGRLRVVVTGPLHIGTAGG
jgi:hypothetical protein